MIAKTKPDAAADSFAWDNKLPGFGIRTRDGRATYVVQYKLGKQQRRMTIGSTAKLTREQAVREAKKIFGKVAGGEDPQGSRKAVRAAVPTDTFKAIAERFIAYQATQWRPASLSATERYLMKHFGRLHVLKADAIKRTQVAAILSDIATKHGPVAADRACSAISSCFAWARRDGLVEENPISDMNKYAGVTQRDRVLTDDELAAIWLAQEDDDYGRIIKLLILTGQRKTEIADLSRVEIRDGAIELPGERTKNHKPHIVPLSAGARAVVDEQLRKTNRNLIFGKGERGFSGWSKAKRELDAKLPLKPWTVHDIRRSVSTGMNELGIEPHVVEATLNHISGYRSGVAGVYNRASYIEQKTAALDLWARHVAAIVAGAAKRREAA